MEITCAQMDVLISFYLEGDLSKQLKTKVEEHLKKCSVCKTKYEIIKSMLNDLRNSFNDDENLQLKDNCKSNSKTLSHQYRIFKNNLSAYMDNELSSDENLKIKKFAINNQNARKDLEDAYNIRKLMNDSFSKTKGNVKQDFARNIVKQLDPNDENNLGFHPVLKYAAAFVFTVLSLSTIIIFSLTL